MKQYEEIFIANKNLQLAFQNAIECLKNSEYEKCKVLIESALTQHTQTIKTVSNP